MFRFSWLVSLIIFVKESYPKSTFSRSYIAFTQKACVILACNAFEWYEGPGGWKNKAKCYLILSPCEQKSNVAEKCNTRRFKDATCYFKPNGMYP